MKSPRSKTIIHGCEHCGATWEWHVPPQKSIPVRFCMETSLHGLHHIVEPGRHICERIIWLVTFSAALVAAVLLIFEMWSGYQNMPIITVFNPTELTLEQIPFPGITIFSVNSIKKSTREKISQNFYTAYNTDPNFTMEESLRAFAAVADANDICDFNAQTFITRHFIQRGSKLDEGVWELVRTVRSLPSIKAQKHKPFRNPPKLSMDGSQSCSDMLMKCVWLDNVQNCNELFTETETDFGHCCTFNTIPTTLLLKYLNDPRDDENVVDTWADANVTYDNLFLTEGIPKQKVPRRQKHSGRSSGLSVILDPELHEYICPNLDSNGFMIGISSSLDFPRIRDSGIPIRPDTEVFVSIRPEITLSDESTEKFSLDKRQCYWGDEYELKHYSKYTVSNCLDECIAQKSMDECECVRYYMPRKPEYQVCRPYQYECTDNVRKNLSQQGLNDSCDLCLPTCTEISYSAAAAALKVNKELSREFVNTFFPESSSKKEFSIVHLYFEVDSVYPRMRKELYSIVNLISNAGGLLGLCMGFSALSLLEVLYYFTMRVVCKYYRKQSYKSNQCEQENSDTDYNDKEIAIPINSKNPNVMDNGWNVNNGYTLNNNKQYPSVFVVKSQRSINSQQYPSWVL